MPGGNNTSTRPVSKPGQPNPVKTVQTLLAAKKKDTSNKEPRAKRTHSEVSNDSNTSHDLSGLINFQKDLDEIKTRYDYNLTIMKSPKPATDNRFKK
jgi:hypothetical protein